MTRFRPFERTSKRRKGFPSETRVKRGARTIKGGEIELLEKLGRNDPCPCDSGLRFQEMLPAFRPVSTGRNGGITGGKNTAPPSRLREGPGVGQTPARIRYTVPGIRIYANLALGLMGPRRLFYFSCSCH